MNAPAQTLPAVAVCRWCEDTMTDDAPAGRSRLYCTDECRQGAEAERRNLRRLIAKYEAGVIAQTGRFLFGAQDARPRLAAARARLADLTASA